jgi:hypothetical protein
VTWRPMDSAPKDGTVILAWSESLSHVIVQWAPDAGQRTGWRVCWDFAYLARNPLRWMPLPAAPLEVSR